MRIYRWDPKTGEKQPAQRDRNGFFVLGHPSKGNEKHHSANKILEVSEEKAIKLVLSGYSIRVKTPTAPSLVNRNLFIDGKQIR